MRERVSVITRTYNRNLFLRRAYSSIFNQNYSAIEWIIVNDGGDPEELEILIESIKRVSDQIKILHNKNNLGRAAAANIGVRSASSCYCVLHDDDDTWESDFLDQTVRFLELHPEDLAVNTHALEVVEKIDGENIKEISRRAAPFNTDTITFMKMLTFNPVSTIGCVFRRSAYESLTGFDESLPILEDYDFFIRMLCLGDIGNLSVPLAHYHIRYECHDKSSLNNTVTIGKNWHKEMLSKYRNYHLRKDLVDGKFGLGHLLVLGEMNETLFLANKSFSDHLEKLKKISGYSFFRDRFTLK